MVVPVKAILQAAKVLSSPVSAIASVFRKKKGLKRGPTAASAGLVRRKYKKRSSAYSAPKLANDGNGNLRMAKRIGTQPRRLNRGLESKIRDVLNPANHHSIQQSGNVHIDNGQCVYTHFEMMNGTDIDQVITQSNGTSASSVIPFNAKINIQNAKMTVHLRNQTTNLVYLTVYEYICRRDVPDKIQIVPNQVPEVDGNTQKVIEVGFNYQQTAGINVSSLGGTLFQNPLFCTYYKITKVRKLMLGAGKNLGLSLSNLKARVINPLVYNATDGDVLAGLTRGFVIQASGALVGGSGDNMYGQPTTGLVNFDWFCYRKYAWNQPWVGTAKNTLTSNLPADDKPWHHINEYTGVAQVETEA